MSPSRRRLLQTSVVALVVLVAGFSAVLAFKMPDAGRRFDAKTIADPSIVVAPMIVSAQENAVPQAVREAWNAFQLANGPNWDIYVDTRSGAPTLVQGQGIPFIPGSGNTLASATPVTLDAVVALVRTFAAKNAGLLLADDKELVLNEAASGQLTPDLWRVAFDHVVSGVPVAGDQYVFSIGHGNLISFGAPRWTGVKADAVPAVPANEAVGFLMNYMGLTPDDEINILDAGTLNFLPMTAAGAPVDSFDGPLGTGYDAALVWRVALRINKQAATMVGMVDAHTGAVLALNDETQYAQTKGGIFPITDDGIAPDGVEKANFPMPFADITINSTSSASSSMGYFACTPGGSNATTTLQGAYIKVADVCGAISKSVTCDADMDMGASAGTDCTTPGSGGAGNTHAARSSFYHLNRIKEHARSWLSSNTWLQGQLTDNVNIALTCNAFWDDGGATGTVNFYRSGGGCRNTGEIAAVFLHEWGHGLDQNDGGGYDNPSEAYADVSSFLLTHKSCIGRGFRSTNCSGYGNACLNCTGVRDQDYTQHTTGVPQTADNWTQVASCSSGSGPCSKEVHCESYVSGETLWDLAVRDLPAAGLDQQTAWQVLDRDWYVSRTGSGGNAYSCGTPASTRSCTTTYWMQELRIADDDDGNLANGTPHAAAIFAAFNRHTIPCGASTDATNLSTTSCPTLAAPTLTATGSLNTVSLSWTAVPNATSYNVLRNDQSCDWGHTIIANVTGTSYTDSNLPNGFPLYYSVQAVGSNSACTGTLATCTTGQAVGPCTPTFTGISTVTNPASSTCTLSLGWTAATSTCGGTVTYNVYRSTTSGFTPAAGNRIAAGLIGTSYVDAVGLAYGSTYYYIVRAQDSFNNIEETNTVQKAGVPTGPISPGGWTDTFEGSQSGGGFDQTGWTHAYLSGATDWTWSTAYSHDGTHSWFAQDTNSASDKVLTSPAFNVLSNTTLSFWHTYAFESTSTCYDGGTLEYTTDGGTTWTVVPDADFTAGVFTGTVSTGSSNPISGERAWCGGTIGALTQVSVNLGGDANLLNKTVQIRWHEGDDANTYVTGWYVDTVTLANAGIAGSCVTGTGCTAPGAPTLTGAWGDCNGINLVWTAGTGATNSYNVYRATASGGPYALVGSAPTTTGTSYTDTTAAGGVTYYYVVRGACDAGGAGESGNSNELSAARLVSPTPTITGAAANTCPATGVVLTTEAGKANYQWYLGGSPIGGANSNSYAATVSGTYTVGYTDTNGCSGISAGKAVTIIACAANIVYQSHGTITQATGDGDAWYERGEKWSVSVTLTNTGNMPASNVTATFGGNGITVCTPVGSFGTIPVGGTGTATFQFVISPSVACGSAITFTVTGKASTEYTPAGADESNVFSITAGQGTVGSPTNLVIQPSSADTYVNQYSSTTSYGTATTMLTNMRTSREEDLLVQFSLSGLPAGATINSATLELYATAAPTTGYTLNVNRNTATWTESTTWAAKPAYDSTVIASLAGGTTTGWKIWTVTSLVQAWYAGTYTNYGLTVRPSTISGSTTYNYTFATKEYTTNTAYRPILRVNYTPATTWDCSYTGSGSCCGALTAPTNNTATDPDMCADGGVQVSWSQDLSDWGDGGSGTRTYDVLRNGSPIATGIAYGTTSYTDTTGVNGTTYTYAVRYHNGCGSAATTSGASAADNATICTALDQCHDVGTCDPGTGVCTNPAKANGYTCDDGNACTQTDTCQGGVCSGSNPVVCTALDQCHDVGICNTTTGACSNPAKPNGFTCDDGDACTQTDTCQGGACTGSNTVTCTALDQCHDIGTCDTGTGLCSNPPKVNGTTCNDGSACTQTDACQNGVCVGGNPVVCTALDQCHDVGTCNPLSGACSNPAKVNGTTCDDGNLCTQTDACQGGICTGVNPVTCTALDQCHDVGVCNPASGSCSNPPKANGTTCNDGDLCTQVDTCQGGACVGDSPVICTASDQCHDVGTCDPGTGVCSNPAKPNGYTCNDGDLCTQTDACQNGVCTGSNPVTCTALDQCHNAGICDPQTGLCTNPPSVNGTTCTDGNACTQTDACQDGACVGANPVVCTALDQCHNVGACDPQTGACSNPAKANGTTCDDSDLCTQTDTCQNGACVGDNPVVCPTPDQCHDVGSCNPTTGQCSNPAKPNGTTCDDGSLCTQADACENGACVGSNPVTCTALDQCHGAGSCNPQTGACSNPAKPNGATCNDGDLCTQADACENGACIGANPVVCSALDQCHDAGSCNPQTGACTNPAKPNGATCDDGNVCTAGDACQAGFCVSGTVVPPPAEVDNSVMVTLTTPTTAQITWTLPFGATSADVLRGLASALPVGPGGGDESCIGPGAAGVSLTDTDLPPVGDSFWYLVRGASVCGKGTYGFQVNPPGAPVQRTSATCP